MPTFNAHSYRQINVQKFRLLPIKRFYIELQTESCKFMHTWRATRKMFRKLRNFILSLKGFSVRRINNLELGILTVVYLRMLQRGREGWCNFGCYYEPHPLLVTLPVPALVNSLIPFIYSYLVQDDLAGYSQVCP